MMESNALSFDMRKAIFLDGREHERKLIIKFLVKRGILVRYPSLLREIEELP
jgi:hypothetical protein